MIKAVVFDLDDTLISEREYIDSGFRHISNMVSSRYCLDKEKVYILMSSKFEEDSENVFNRTLDSLEVSYDKDYIRKLITLYREHLPKIKLYDDSKYILDYLYSNKIKLGMITDGYKIAQRNKIEVLNIESFFDYIVVTDELGREYWKPHPKPYEIIKEKLNVDYASIIYIGDNENKDFITANKLGIITVLVKRVDGIYFEEKVSNEYKAEIEIKNLYELTRVINNLKKLER